MNTFTANIVCPECSGTGLDHPCSWKSRNTDDDSCPKCKGKGFVEVKEYPALKETPVHRRPLLSTTCVLCYLFAIMLANYFVTVFGQAALPYTAFILIPFDLMARDVLHEYWKEDGNLKLWTRMLLLICLGSFLSYASSMSSGRIATASAISFLLTGIMDSVSYAALDKHSKWIKMNGSNLLSALVDSLLFPMIAFGSINYLLSFEQSVSKFCGGILWTLVFLLLSKKIHAYNNYERVAIRRRPPSPRT